MRTTIVDNGGVNEFQFQNGIFVRKVELDPAWTVLRASCIVNNTTWAVNSIPLDTPKLGIGFCSGQTGGSYGDATCTHFVGMVLDTAVQGTGNADQWNAMDLKPAKQVGSTLTTGTVLNGSCMIETAMSFLAIDIIKGTPNYSFRSFCRTAAAAVTPPSDANFVANMEDVTPAYTNHTYSAAQTLAVDEATDGVLDCFAFYWGMISPLNIGMWGVTMWT